MPSTEEIIATLRSVPLFSRLARPHLRALAAIVHETKEYRSGEIVCQQGEPGRQYFIVERGLLRITRVDPEGRVTAVGELGPGAAFGETSLLLGDVRDATVECVRPSVLLYIDKESFDRLLETEPGIERALRMRPDVAERRAYPRFPWLEEGELVIKLVRKHPAVLVPALLVPGLMTLLALLITTIGAGQWGVFAAVVGGILTLIPLGFSLYTYIDWRNDLYVVTNLRVIHRERTGLVRVSFSAAPLSAIQDIQQIQIGIASRIWGYGDLIVETAGEAGQVVFRSIPRPDRVRNTIFDQISRARALVRARERATIYRAMRKHFLQEGEEGAGELPPQPSQELGRRPGCLALISAVVSTPVRGTWHREGETVTWRKHWIVLIRTVGIPVLLFLAITGLVLFVIAKTGADPTVTVLYALASFIIIPWFLWQVEDWQNDYYQVTATRIIHVERLPFFIREERREARLEQITNVRFAQSFWGRVLHFGDVVVETAAPAGAFHFRTVYRPDAVQAEIFSHIEAARRRQREQEAERRRTEMLDWFSVYDEIRSQSGKSSPSPQKEAD